MSKKLEKVLEYLINNQEDKATELLHQVFIEKARAIHEDLINMDDEMEMDEVTCADEGDDLMHDVDHKSDELDELADEIEAEETMAEDEDMDMDMDMEMDVDMPGEAGPMDADMMDAGDDMDADMDMDMDMDMDDEAGEGTPDIGELEDEMHDLEDALAELKAEFEKLEAGEDHDEMADDEEAAEDHEDAADDEEAAEDHEDAADDEEEPVDESWLSEFDDLEESVSLEKVANPHGEGEVGAGHYAPVETNTKSPIAKAPDAVMGAKPVKTGEGPTKSGYNKETAPSTKGELPHTEDNRRKKSTDKMSKVSPEGDSSAKLNKTKSEFGADTNKKSPLTNAPRK